MPSICGRTSGTSSVRRETAGSARRCDGCGLDRRSHLLLAEVGEAQLEQRSLEFFPINTTTLVNVRELEQLLQGETAKWRVRSLHKSLNHLCVLRDHFGTKGQL